MSQIPENTIPAPPYSEGRLTFGPGSESHDVVPIRAPEIWHEAFPDGDVDWNEGWRTLWSAAGSSLGTHSDFVEGRAGIEVEAYFGTGEMVSIGVAYANESGDEDEWLPKASQLIADVCGKDIPIAGCIGLVVSEDDELARPCLTLIVSGPGGSAEAAQIIKLALADCGLSAGIATRTVRQNSAGVVKIPFLPELYLAAGHSSFGINWEMWLQVAARDPEAEWGSAALLWCDIVIAAVSKVFDDASLSMDRIQFDFMRTVPLGTLPLTSELIEGRRSLGDVLRLQPHLFLFGKCGASKRL